MTISNGVQVLELLYSLALGSILGVLYVLIHLFRKIRIAADIVFSLIAVISTIMFFITVCEGPVRAYQVIGIIAGMLAVQVIFRKLLLRNKNG